MAKENNISTDIIGSGWRFPLEVSGRGGVALSSADKDVEESIRIILSTPKGERRMRPNFGCNIHDLVFAPNTSTTWSLIAHHVEEALGWWEPRIEVMEVDVHPDITDTSRLLINIKYKVKDTTSERNLVYPFYLSR
jgi:phage baseplate assembly protein W